MTTTTRTRKSSRPAVRVRWSDEEGAHEQVFTYRTPADATWAVEQFRLVGYTDITYGRVAP